MKKYILVTVLALFFGGVALAQYGRYQVFSEKRHFWGPKIIIMLDSDTGKTWEYSDSKWKLLKREVEEKAEVNDEMQTRQEELLKALEMEQMQKQMEGAKKPPKSPAPRVVKKKKPKPVDVDSEGEGEDAPGWIND